MAMRLLAAFASVISLGGCASSSPCPDFPYPPDKVIEDADDLREDSEAWERWWTDLGRLEAELEAVND